MRRGRASPRPTSSRQTPTDFKPTDADRRHTNLVATNDFEEFTFITRVRTFDQQHGQIKHQKLSFSKSQFASERGEKNTILQKLNEIEYDEPTAIFGDLYDTRQIVSEFYEHFEALRTDLVQEVSGIPDDRGDAKGRYVQVTLDRMIFLYFIQEKRLLDRNLDYLREYHDEEAEAGNDVYDAFYEPLFFDALGEGDHIKRFKNVPYLNGGLFSKNPIEEEFPDAKLGATTAETNALFDRILEFLSDWNWNVDERLDIVDPKNLSPAVLGHIFEQTVNQKEMGAYYTPEEITGFMTRRSIHPYLLDQLNEAVGADYDEIDEVFGLDDVAAGAADEAVADGETITQQAPTDQVQTEHVETLYFDILRDTRVLDPAVGSGAFLLAAQDVLLDIYLQCLEFFETLENEGAGWQLANRTREELEQIQGREAGKSLYAKREIILNNLYGVDIDDGAVEICKLRLWLSMVADIEDEPSEVDPLPNIDFNIRQGNSLIGFTELQEVANDDGDGSLSNWGGGVGTAVQDLYEDVIEAVERHQNATSSKEAANARKLAEQRIEAHSETLDEKVLKQFHDAGIEDISIEDLDEFYPFHWVLEFAPVYRDGGFDVVIGNPPWDVLSPNRDDYFVKHDEAFRTRMPADKDETMEQLLSDPDVERGWEEYQREMEQRAEYFNESEYYTLQTPEIEGKRVQNENDLSMLFLERIFDIVRSGGYAAQILPGNLFNGASAKGLRQHLLNNTETRDIIGFENRGIFDGIHNQYRFGVISFRNSGTTEVVRGVFEQTDLEVLRDIERNAFEIPGEVLERYSPKARTFPNLTEEREVSVLNTLVQHPPISKDIADTWYASLYSEELHRSKDSDRFVESEQEGDYPVYEGKNIFQFTYDERFHGIDPISLWSVSEDNEEQSGRYRIRMKNFRSRDPEISLKKAIYEEFNGSGSQKGFVNDLLEKHGRRELSPEDVLLDCTRPRIAIREIARATDERTLIASVIAEGAVTAHTLHTVRPYKVNPTEEDLSEYPMYSAYENVFTDSELFVALGVLNSVPFDYLMRTKVDTHIVKYKFLESQLPRLTDGDDWFHYIADRAARLNCYGDKFAEMRDRLGGIDPATDTETRRQLQAEIDAAAFHAYGLDHDEVEFVLDDFHRVQKPRIMTEVYFDSVLAKYEELAEAGPME